jgi:hypothetical protein
MIESVSLVEQMGFDPLPVRCELDLGKDISCCLFVAATKRQIEIFRFFHSLA